MPGEGSTARQRHDYAAFALGNFYPIDRMKQIDEEGEPLPSTLHTRSVREETSFLIGTFSTQLYAHLVVEPGEEGPQVELQGKTLWAMYMDWEHRKPRGKADLLAFRILNNLQLRIRTKGLINQQQQEAKERQKAFEADEGGPRQRRVQPEDEDGEEIDIGGCDADAMRRMEQATLNDIQDDADVYVADALQQVVGNLQAQHGQSIQIDDSKVSRPPEQYWPAPPIIPNKNQSRSLAALVGHSSAYGWQFFSG
jgi:hypothetical protein